MKTSGQILMDAVNVERQKRFWADLIMGAPEEQEWRRQQAAQAELWRALHEGRTMGKVEA